MLGRYGSGTVGTCGRVIATGPHSSVVAASAGTGFSRRLELNRMFWFSWVGQSEGESEAGRVRKPQSRRRRSCVRCWASQLGGGRLCWIRLCEGTVVVLPVMCTFWLKGGSTVGTVRKRCTLRRAVAPSPLGLTAWWRQLLRSRVCEGPAINSSMLFVLGGTANRSPPASLVQVRRHAGDEPVAEVL